MGMARGALSVVPKREAAMRHTVIGLFATYAQAESARNMLVQTGFASTDINLQAHPDAFLVMDGQRHAVHARTAGAEEKAELWPKIVAAYKGYAGYQERTDRDIPVVICELQD